MWGGRFALGPAEALDALNRSLPVDHRLWPQDVAASKAWVHALGRVGVLSAEEEAQLLDGLDRVAERLADGAAAGAPDEDVHTLVERLLYEEVGAAAGKLHTGRSRNDQVATDLRLWTLDAVDQLDADLATLGRVLVEKAREGVDVLLPGYTHGQRAQPVRWAYVLLAHAWPLTRDRQRLADARRRVAELPLGSGALAGSGFPVDRVLLKEALGFRAVSSNALDVTGDRDFVAEVLFVLALVGTHLSRLSAELVAYASGEFGFVRLSDAFSTGSSLMPQKRNPDVFELTRAKSARLLGDLVAMLTRRTKRCCSRRSTRWAWCCPPRRVHWRRWRSTAGAWPRPSMPRCAPRTSPTCWSRRAFPSGRVTGWWAGSCARPSARACRWTRCPRQ